MRFPACSRPARRFRPILGSRGILSEQADSLASGRLPIEICTPQHGGVPTAGSGFLWKTFTVSTVDATAQLLQMPVRRGHRYSLKLFGDNALHERIKQNACAMHALWNPVEQRAKVSGAGDPRDPTSRSNSTCIGEENATACLESSQVLGTNLVGPFLVAQAVGRSMIRHKLEGSIINISSVAGQAPSASESLWHRLCEMIA